MEYIFFGAVVAFLLGVTIAPFATVTVHVAALFAVIAGGVMIVARKRAGSKSASALFLVSVCGLCFSFGLLRMEVAQESLTHSVLTSREGEAVELTGVVVREPEVRSHSTLLFVSVEDELLLVSTDRYVDIAYGDEVVVEGVLKEPESFTTEFGREFNYPGYLHAKGVRYQIAYADVEKVGEGQGNPVLAVLLQVKHRLMEGIEAVIPEPQAGLGEGLLLGVKQGLGEELETAFRKAGIIHIVVLSGYNIMLIVTFVMAVLARFLRPTARLWCGLLAILSFALMVGLSATVVRASIMAGLLLLAGTLGRLYHMLRALLLAGVVMVAINPFLLLYDIGFQLSFMATLGLILILPVLESLFLTKLRMPGKEYLGATIATQIAVLPLILYHIGEMSLVAVVVNMIVLPLVPIAMLGTFLAGLLALVSPLVALPVAFLTNLILSYIIVVATWFGALLFAAVSAPVFSVPVMVVLYMLMAMYLVWFHHRSPKNEYADWVIEEETETGEARSASPVETPIFFR